MEQQKISVVYDSTRVDVPHNVDSTLKKHEASELGRSVRNKDKSDRATQEQVV